MMAASPRIRNALTLFSCPDCVVCHRVRLVLAAKGVTYELVPVDPANPPEDLLDLNPYHSVPTLVDRDLVLYAASVVSRIPRRALSASAADAGGSALARAPAPGDAARSSMTGCRTCRPSSTAARPRPTPAASA